MRSGFIRGALLPFFFIWTGLFSQDGLEKYFSVFYNDINEYRKWYQLEKNDHFKDIFIELYNLPKVEKRTLNRNLNLKVLKSLSKDEEYGYLYLDVQTPTSFESVLYGVSNGEIFINGISKGQIKIQSDTGYSYLSGTFQKGVFFVLIRIKDRFKNVPVIMLSNKELNRSVDKGFSKNASFSFNFKNVENTISQSDFLRLFGGFCFPYTNEKNREQFFSVTAHEKRAGIEKQFLLGDIYNSIYNKKDKEDLLKNGFSQNQIKWWQERFLSGEVCKYD
ncbi:MAG TPA: hypothetical protein PKG52_04450 [bacterium]|nr:hypothetical protein [bacterium]HPS29811.1 hypothetical protein [bacterium]